MTDVQHADSHDDGRLTSSVERARHTRDRASLAVFAVSAMAAGSAASAALHHWVSIGDGQARVLAVAAGVGGGLAALKLIGRVFPWIFRATRWERR